MGRVLHGSATTTEAVRRARRIAGMGLGLEETVVPLEKTYSHERRFKGPF